MKKILTRQGVMDIDAMKVIFEKELGLFVYTGNSGFRHAMVVYERRFADGTTEIVRGIALYMDNLGGGQAYASETGQLAMQTIGPLWNCLMQECIKTDQERGVITQLQPRP